MLAWIRTSVSLMTLGFVVARFGLFLHEMATLGRGAVSNSLAAPGSPPGAVPSLWVGVGLITTGVLILAMAGREHARFRRSYRKGISYEVPSISVGLLLCMALALLGIGLAIYLIILSH